jgi:hypothetical protein
MSLEEYYINFLSDMVSYLKVFTSEEKLKNHAMFAMPKEEDY